MNTPSLHGGNWKWRYNSSRLTKELSDKAAHLAGSFATAVSRPRGRNVCRLRLAGRRLCEGFIAGSDASIAT